MENVQFVDPDVTQRKYEEELSLFNQTREINRRRGIMLLEAKFPNIYIAFCAPQLSPAPIVFAVRINFDNYDVIPLSVQFIDPFTFDPILIPQIKTVFPRKLEGQIQPQHLLQAEEDQKPFFCIPGVREYHDHVFHTGDSWLLHRRVAGEGTLGYLVEKLCEYGIQPLNSYHFNINIAIPNLPFGYDKNKIPL